MEFGRRDTMEKDGNPFVTAAFDPAKLALLTLAYEKARRALHDKGQPSIVTDVIVGRIIALAQAGELDPDRLCAGALSALGRRSDLDE